MSSPSNDKISYSSSKIIIPQIINKKRKIEPESTVTSPTSTYPPETSPILTFQQTLCFHIELLSQCLCRNNSMIEVIIEVCCQMTQNNRKLETTAEKMKAEIDLIRERLRPEEKTNFLKPIELDMSQKNDAFLAAKFGNRNFKYSLLAVKSIPKELFKERNFNLIFKLVDSNKNIVTNCNAIPISITLFDPSNPDKPITECQRGLPIFKGNQESSLYRGRCQFKKLHIREVTSHFTHGKLYALLYPKQPSFEYAYQQSNQQVTVDYRDIKPYVVTSVVVRAKKK